jgi:glutaredoxin
MGETPMPRHMHTSHLTLTLYTKPGCHLCEAVEQVIQRVRRDFPFDLIKRNILDDRQDQQAYSEQIPVVLLGGREVARYRMTEAQLRAALQANWGDV